MSDIEYSVITSDVIKSFDCTINVHWVPVHKGIGGNELLDMRVKEAAAAVGGKEDIHIEIDNKLRLLHECSFFIEFIK